MAKPQPPKRKVEKAKTPFSHDLERQEMFLKEYARTGVFGQAARSVEMTPTAVYDLKDKDEEFSERCELAYQAFKDSIDEMIRSRVVDGIPKGVWYQGMKVGKEVEFDTTLTLAFAKRHMPEYRDKSSIDMNTTGGLLVVTGTLTPEEWEKQADDAKLPPESLDS